jgi:hypothetical protein
MNVICFKKLCLKAGTKKADEIHDYYLKLEELLQETMKEESEALKLQLEEKQKQLEEKDKKIGILEHKPHTHGFSSWKNGYVYLLNDRSKPGHYKIGMAIDTDKRIRNLNTGSSEKSLNLYYEVEVYDTDLFEKMIQNMLQPFNIKGRREWFYRSDDTQVEYAIHLIDQVCLFLNQFHFNTHKEFLKYVINNNITNKILPNEIETTLSDNEEILETNICKLTRQQSTHRTGNYKGVCFSNEKQKWKAELKKDYKINFLGYYDTELDAAKAYNNYATFLNQNDNTNNTLTIMSSSSWQA